MQLWELVEMVTEEIWVWRRGRTHPSPHQFLTVCSHYQAIYRRLLFSCVWLFCSPMDYNQPGSYVHGISQARILQWVAIGGTVFYSSPPSCSTTDQGQASAEGRSGEHWRTYGSGGCRIPAKSTTRSATECVNESLETALTFKENNNGHCFPSTFQILCESPCVQHWLNHAGRER